MCEHLRLTIQIITVIGSCCHMARSRSPFNWQPGFVRPGTPPQRPAPQWGSLGTGAAREGIAAHAPRTPAPVTQCLETEDLREGADPYPWGLYCSWTS
jgi:hypothetical protein